MANMNTRKSMMEDINRKHKISILADKIGKTETETAAMLQDLCHVSGFTFDDYLQQMLDIASISGELVQALGSLQEEICGLKWEIEKDDNFYTGKLPESGQVHDIKETPLPLNRRVLVYVVNINAPGWYFDYFTELGPSDLRQVNGSYYAHNITHWQEVPAAPKGKAE